MEFFRRLLDLIFGGLGDDAKWRAMIDYIGTRAELMETANDLFGMVGSGNVKIEINHSYALRDAAAAHRDVEARKTTGSVVLIP